jgi:hypothetical protein
MDKSTATIWRETFLKWPPNFRRKGVIELVKGEAIPFVEFLMTEDVVVVERATPDTTGARRVAVPFQNIVTLKYTEPLKTDAFLLAGYVLGANVNAAPKRGNKVPIKAVPVNAAVPPQAAPPSPAS